MKKIFLLGLAASAILTSCSNDENVEMPEPNAITFAPFVNKSTRATDITNDNISNFSVYGFMEQASGVIFDGELVTGSGSSWSYANLQYWTPGKTYYFTAIAPAVEADWTFTPLAGGASGQGGSISFTNDGDQDLLYAYNGGITAPATVTASDPGAVAFTFRHLLSRVKFNFTNAIGNDNTTLKITSVKITDANTKAAIDVADPTSMKWILSDDNAASEFDFGGIETAIANNANDEVAHKYLIPCKQEYRMEFVVEMYVGDVLAATYSHTGDNAVTVPEVDMQPGHSYVFKAELTNKNIIPGDDELYPIVFTVENVTEWENWENGNEGSLLPTE